MPNLSQGPFSPGSASTVAGGSGITWTNPSNIKLDDGASFAAATFTGAGQITDALIGNTYGFNIPLSATLLGVLFTYKGKVPAGVTNDPQEQVIVLANGNSAIGTNKAFNTLSTTLTQFSFGGSNDLWNAGLTLALVNSNAFGVYCTWAQAGANRTVDIDAYKVTVYYSVPPTKFFFMGGQDN